MKRIITLAMALCLLLNFVALAEVEQSVDKSVKLGTEEDGPFGRYAEPVKVTMVKSTSDGDSWKWDALAKVGETLEDNRYTRSLKEELNIEVEYIWVVDDSQYDQKMKLSIASGEMPDFLRIPQPQLSSLMQLAEEEQIIPIDDLWEKYASPLTKKFATDDGGLIMSAIAYNGQMMGVPQPTASIGNNEYFWLRTDWMEKLNLTPPTTMDEFVEYMRAIKAADPGNTGAPYGMMVAGKSSANPNGGMWDQLAGFFWCFGAYPTSWIETADGKLTYGAVLPEMKDGLKLLQQMYAEGLLDPEFIVKDFDTAKQIIAAGQAGAMFGFHWMTHSALTYSRENDPEADWGAFPMPSATGEQTLYRTDLGLRSVFAINKDCEHPEAIIKMMNHYNEKNFGEGADYEYYSSPFIEGQLINDIWYIGPIDSLHDQIDAANIAAIQPVFAGEKDPSELVGTALSFYNNCISEWTWMRMFGPGNTPGIQMVEAVNNPDTMIQPNLFVGAPTETMLTHWTQICELRNTFVTQVITGEVSVDEGFDEFVANWMNMGGEKITEEVNAWYEANVKK